MGLKTKFAGLMAGVALFGTLGTRTLAKTPDNPDPDPRTEFAANFDDVAADPGAGGKDSPNPKQTGDKDKVKIEGYDMRGTGKNLKKIQGAAGVLSMRGKVVILAYMNPKAKTDPAIKAENDQFEQDIKEAIIKNIKAGRTDIVLIYADAQPGTRSRLVGLANGHLMRQVNYYDTEDLDVYVRRVYDEYGYTRHISPNASTSKSMTDGADNVAIVHE